LIILFAAGIILQGLQLFAWQVVELSPDPREVSSVWIINNVQKGTVIGVENIPIYQMLPNIVLKEFYLKDANSKEQTRFNYKVVSANDKILPKAIIITNDFENVDYISDSPKKELVKRVQAEHYKKIITFVPNVKYFNLFSDNLMFFLLFPTPRTISLYEKM
jgi:hypothetical protein